MKTGTSRPTCQSWRASLPRRALFQVHLWLGIALACYLCVMSLSGAALVFRFQLVRVVLIQHAP